MGEKKERGRFTLRFNEGDPIHETAIGLLELQSPRTKAQYVANAVVYYNEHLAGVPRRTFSSSDKVADFRWERKRASIKSPGFTPNRAKSPALSRIKQIR